MDNLQVTDSSKLSSRSGSPGVTDIATVTHQESWRHHSKSHSRDLARDPIIRLDDSPHKRAKELGALSPAAAAAFTLTPDEITSVSYRGADTTDSSLQYQSGDDADGGSGSGGQTARAATAIAQLNTKVARTRELIRLEQTLRDDNVKEYLKLAQSADKQQLQRIKAVFEKKNQKSAHSIAQYQKKLEQYHKRISNWEQYGSGGGQGAHRQPREVLRDMGQGLKNMGGNIRDGITGLGGSVMAAPREFAHMLTRASRFGSADNIPQFAGSRTSEGAQTTDACGARGSTLPRAGAPSPPQRKSTPDDGSEECSSVTSESVPYGDRERRVGDADCGAALADLRQQCDALSQQVDALKQAVPQEVAYLLAQLQEERFRTERLEEQVNDLTELHQNEVENLKQALTDVEEKVQYQSEERIRDLHEALDLCHTKLSKLEHVCAQAGVASGAAAGGEPANLPPRVILVKLLNVALTLLQLVLLLAATVAGITMPFLRTRVRVISTALVLVAAAILVRRWPDALQTFSNYISGYIDPPERQR